MCQPSQSCVMDEHSSSRMWEAGAAHFESNGFSAEHRSYSDLHERDARAYIIILRRPCSRADK
jgi:hypothetical protein